MRCWSKFRCLRRLPDIKPKVIILWLKGNLVTFIRLLKPKLLHLFLFFLASGSLIIKIVKSCGHAIRSGFKFVVKRVNGQVSNFLGLPKPKLLNLFLFLVALATPFYFARVSYLGVYVAGPIGAKWIYASLAVLACIAVIIWAEGQKAQSEPIDKIADFVRILGDKVEAIAILLVATLFILEAPERKAEKHAELWQVIDNAAGIETSYARIKAIQALLRDRVSLEGIDLPDADLSRVNFNKADLSFANLSNADLSDTTFRNADLSNADLSRANLSGTVFSNVDLTETDLSEANFSNANLSGIDFSNADLSGTDFSNADLSNADFVEANLSNAIFLAADLQNIDAGLLWSHLKSEKPPLICNASLPESIEIDGGKSLDCNKIANIFHQRYSDEFESLEKAARHVNTLSQKTWE